MQHSGWRWFAVISVALALSRVSAATRPRYGGTLRMDMRARVTSLDPAARPADPVEAAAAAKLQMLIFDRLVRVDDNGRPQPALALSWQSDPERKRWEFRLRPGVKFHDGYPLTATAAGGVLQRYFSGTANVAIAGEALVVESSRAMPGLLAALARPAASVTARSPEGDLVGTGRFRVARWEAGRKITLAAFEDHWSGRPFLDSVEIEMGRPLREASVDLQLGRADLVEIAPNELRSAAERGRKTWSSADVELLALVFAHTPAAEEPKVREALALSIDRAAIHNVLLQRRGAISGGILPQWLSGYAFLFPASADLQRARRLASEAAPGARALLLGYDAADPLARVIADRIAVNARDAGLTLQVTPQTARADVRLLRVRIGSLDPAQALAEVAPWLGAAEFRPPDDPRPEALYTVERTLQEGWRVIPLFHLPEIYGAGARVKSRLATPVSRTGDLRLADLWLERP
jgi:peptide/nickel transport system substrate-binding protein